MDKTEAIVIETLKRASALIQEAVQMAIPLTAAPEDAVRAVRALTLRALMPRVACEEFIRRGGDGQKLFGGTLTERNLGCPVHTMFGWAWLLDVDVDYHGTMVSVAFNHEQAEEIHRRLSNALHAA